MGNILEKLAEKFTFNKKNQKPFCYGPFAQVFISLDGDVSLCSEYMVRNPHAVYLGNLIETSFDKLLNSQIVKDIRKNINENCYMNCVVQTCANKTNFYMQVLNDYIKRNGTQNFGKYPKIVVLGEDLKMFSSCKKGDNDTPFYTELCKDKIINILKKVDEVVIGFDMEPFEFGEVYAFIKEIAEACPNLKFNIASNGILFDKKHCDELGITDRLSNAYIFVNAATKETYDKYVNNGDFETLKENIKWLSSLKSEGKLSNVFSAYYVDENNYTEIPKFVDFAKETGSFALFKVQQHSNTGNKDMTNKNLIICQLNENHQKLLEVLESNDLNTKDSALSFGLNFIMDKY